MSRIRGFVLDNHPRAAEKTRVYADHYIETVYGTGYRFQPMQEH
jgi:hypothetical protein